ncbi:unnamed protein product [Ostreobium quekettii]|uniref:Uncharacterized protein n=1 Tax=Ostreobium quekettii TaxID=121088 RepID=A0A8S1IUV5_9CHLO|nr:unnamed protein product [Ostreobium quekettii]
MSSPGSQAPGSTSRPESPSDPDPGHGGQQRREQPQTAERLPAAGALVLEAILLKRQQLYQTVLKALEGRGSADEHYTRVLMGIQELLEAEDVASVAEEDAWMRNKLRSFQLSVK